MARKSKPNMQNIPVRTPEGAAAKKSFIGRIDDDNRKILDESKGIQVRDDISDSKIVVVRTRDNAILKEVQYTPGRIETWTHAYSRVKGFQEGWLARDKYQNGF